MMTSSLCLYTSSVNRIERRSPLSFNPLELCSYLLLWTTDMNNSLSIRQFFLLSLSTEVKYQCTLCGNSTIYGDNSLMTHLWNTSLKTNPSFFVVLTPLFQYSRSVSLRSSPNAHDSRTLTIVFDTSAIRSISLPIYVCLHSSTVYCMHYFTISHILISLSL